jgi:predicted AlkP superfamily phosphohydrolase/phosphomutase
MIGVDAGEPRLIERWTSDGSLPRLARLMEDGAYGRLASPADWLVGSPWPTFFTGVTPADHGFYHYLQWNPARMAAVPPVPDDLPVEPFWRPLAARGPRAVVFDVPFSQKPEPFNGLELCGWGTHDHLGPPCSFPTSIAADVVERFGRSPLSREVHRAAPIGRLLKVRDELIRTTEWMTDVALDLERREAWELFLVCLSATHRGGHKLWSETSTLSKPGSPGSEEFADALRQVYVAVDRAVGRLIDAAGRDTTVVIFSTHGMGPNTCHTPLLDQMLRQVLGESRRPPVSRSFGLLSALRNTVPLAARSEIGARLPESLQTRLASFWETGGLEWASTRALCPVADLQGYIRLNVRGREAFGIVEPGSESEALGEEIEAGLKTFVDATTGEAVVEAVARPAELYPDGVKRDSLPDIIVRWSETPIAERSEIRSSSFGSVYWPTPGRNPNGRSGNHRPEGFVLAAGHAYRAGTRLEGHVMDLVPTVYSHFGLQPPPGLRGRPLVSASQVDGGRTAPDT